MFTSGTGITKHLLFLSDLFHKSIKGYVSNSCSLSVLLLYFEEYFLSVYGYALRRIYPYAYLVPLDLQNGNLNIIIYNNGLLLLPCQHQH